jgi:hypothetical protein
LPPTHDTHRRCVDCGVALPDDWAGFYCAEHGRESGRHAANRELPADPWETSGEEQNDPDAFLDEWEDDGPWDGITEGVL